MTILAAATASALSGGCALRPAPDVEGSTSPGPARRIHACSMALARRAAGADPGALAAGVQRRDAQRAGRGSPGTQPGPAGFRGTRRAGGSLCGGQREPLPAAQCPGQFQRQEHRRRRAELWRPVRELGARRVGSRARGPRGGAAPVAVRRTRRPVRAPVAGRDGRAGLVPRLRGAPAAALPRRW